MALNDYILCGGCGQKLAYDGQPPGEMTNRDWLMERFGTEDLYCPKCYAQAVAESIHAKTTAHSLAEANEIYKATVKTVTERLENWTAEIMAQKHEGR